MTLPLFEPMEYPNLDAAAAFAFEPVVAGMWRQHEVWDGTYTLDDLLDAHELMAVKAINQGRATQAAEARRNAGAY